MVPLTCPRLSLADRLSPPYRPTSTSSVCSHGPDNDSPSVPSNTRPCALPSIDDVLSLAHPRYMADLYHLPASSLTQPLALYSPTTPTPSLSNTTLFLLTTTWSVCMPLHCTHSLVVQPRRRHRPMLHPRTKGVSSINICIYSMYPGVDPVVRLNEWLQNL